MGRSNCYVPSEPPRLPMLLSCSWARSQANRAHLRLLARAQRHSRPVPPSGTPRVRRQPPCSLCSHSPASGAHGALPHSRLDRVLGPNAPKSPVCPWAPRLRGVPQGVGPLEPQVIQRPMRERRGLVKKRGKKVLEPQIQIP